MICMLCVMGNWGLRKLRGGCNSLIMAVAGHLCQDNEVAVASCGPVVRVHLWIHVKSTSPAAAHMQSARRSFPEMAMVRCSCCAAKGSGTKGQGLLRHVRIMQ